ncbi:26S proteasome non-ATPase regulatory subunit 9 [Anticarsia gemmatalis]|uniref:26S proteasome non-ATPase regulatory subunit 9 n=1 Tax=Anticarsia gemmatalis TaxID=129554 RepID=UPI003F75E51A
MVGQNMDWQKRDAVLKLIEEKDRIEIAIREQTSILESNNIGMHEPLVDAEDYPRNDIDVYKVRHARHQIITLQNTHKAIMKQIEKGLAELHSDFLGSNGEGHSMNTPTTSGNGYMNGHSNGDSWNGGTHEQCFATVGFVTPGSPADFAGLCEHDEILQFGSVNHDNFRDMTQIMEIVSHSVGQTVTVKVKRGHNVLNLNVMPRPWQQPGLLGCQINRKT